MMDMMSGGIDRRDQALLTLGLELKRAGYRFNAVSIDPLQCCSLRGQPAGGPFDRREAL
jgi:hypothetical protein